MNQHVSSVSMAHSHRQQAFSLLEILIVFALLVGLSALLIPVIGVLRTSAKQQLSMRTVHELHLALATYAFEDPGRRFPTPDPDEFIRWAYPGAAPRMLNRLNDLGLASSVTKLVVDHSTPDLLVLVDAWGRPYRYAPDSIAPTGNPTTAATTARPDPKRLDWNATGQVPYDYIWSLGRPLNGSAGQFDMDPDGLTPDPQWIYVHTTLPSHGGP